MFRIRKGQVTIIGGGVAGTNAAKMALGLGAQVTILDNASTLAGWAAILTDRSSEPLLLIVSTLKRYSTSRLGDWRRLAAR